MRLDRYFDVYVISGAVGVRKPDEAIYEELLGQIGAKAADCMYVDDRTKNLAPAARLGFETCLFGADDSIECPEGSVGAADFT